VQPHPGARRSLESMRDLAGFARRALHSGHPARAPGMDDGPWQVTGVRANILLRRQSSHDGGDPLPRDPAERGLPGGRHGDARRVFVILLDSGLAFPGVGAQEPAPDWRAIVRRGRTFLAAHWWRSTMPLARRPRGGHGLWSSPRSATRSATSWMSRTREARAISTDGDDSGQPEGDRAHLRRRARRSIAGAAGAEPVPFGGDRV
jgi:hypothetical protein